MGAPPKSASSRGVLDPIVVLLAQVSLSPKRHLGCLSRFYRAMLCIHGTSHGPVSVKVMGNATIR